MPVDFTPTAHDYARYRKPFPAELFERLTRLEVARAGQRVLDVGAGTGLLGGALARRGCEVTATDVSPALLQRARLDGVTVLAAAARAEALPFGDATFDAVTAAQCWHWFDRDAAPREIRRVLRASGRLAVVYQMYVPLPGSVAEQTERLILRFQPAWRHANSAGINGQVLRDVQVSGFSGIESFTFDVSHGYSHEEWRGLIRTTSAVGGSMPPERVAEFDRDHAAMLLGWPAVLDVPHRVFAAVATRA